MGDRYSEDKYFQSMIFRYDRSLSCRVLLDCFFKCIEFAAMTKTN